MIQHGALSMGRWASFTLSQQILMIGNEMNRAGKLLEPRDLERRADSYERVLYLTDLTIEAHARRGLRRELLRWRDLVALLFLDSVPQPSAHADAFRVLLRFTPEAALQIPYISAGVRSGGNDES